MLDKKKNHKNEGNGRSRTHEPDDAVLPAKSEESSRPVFYSRDERLVAGKALRDKTPRSSHAEWKAPSKRLDPIRILEASNEDRVPELTPIRYGRMMRNPFTFLRGAASLMAYDLSQTPNSGIQVQACGDCHLMNFGLFATPERNLIFDINDFDETLPAPWEWDLKRLAASFVVAGRSNNLSDANARSAVLQCVRSYREHLRQYSKMNPLDVWYDCLDAERLIDLAPDAEAKKAREEMAEQARSRIGDYLIPKISTLVGGRRRLVDQPPILFHVFDDDTRERMEEGLDVYRQSLPDERRVLWDRYRLEDFAVKVVGIGSVGTRCMVGLFFSADNHTLLLQIKEARRSVLEPYVGKSVYDNQGQRVVMGQKLMQSSSDIFLGWSRGRKGYDFYVRQLRDMKFSPPAENVSALQLKRFADICGWALARAHAKSGDAAIISGYLGKSDSFDEAIGDFAHAYADQNERDHAALVKAVKSGRVKAIIEENL